MNADRQRRDCSTLKFKQGEIGGEGGIKTGPSKEKIEKNFLMKMK